MREIEFRGYDLDTKKWYYGNYVKLNVVTLGIASKKEMEENEEHFIIFQGFSDWNLPAPKYQASVDRKSIGQYTGLKDKNDKKIYENDIVNYVWQNKLIKMKVIFKNGEFLTTPINHKDAWDIRISDNEDNLEVIGNDYDNPELMEEGQV